MWLIDFFIHFHHGRRYFIYYQLRLYCVWKFSYLVSYRSWHSRFGQTFPSLIYIFVMSVRKHIRDWLLIFLWNWATSVFDRWHFDWCHLLPIYNISFPHSYVEKKTYELCTEKRNPKKDDVWNPFDKVWNLPGCLNRSLRC